MALGHRAQAEQATLAHTTTSHGTAQDPCGQQLHHTCVHTHTRASQHVHMHAHPHIHEHTYMHIHACIDTHTHA